LHSAATFSTRIGFANKSERPLSERVQRLGITDKNLFPRLRPLGLEDHGEESGKSFFLFFILRKGNL